MEDELKFIGEAEKAIAKQVDFVVRGEGRGARLIKVSWTMDSGAKIVPSQRAIRPASAEEVSLWRLLLSATRQRLER